MRRKGAGLIADPFFVAVTLFAGAALVVIERDSAVTRARRRAEGSVVVGPVVTAGACHWTIGIVASATGRTARCFAATDGDDIGRDQPGKDVDFPHFFSLNLAVVTGSCLERVGRVRVSWPKKGKGRKSLSELPTLSFTFSGRLLGAEIALVVIERNAAVAATSGRAQRSFVVGTVVAASASRICVGSLITTLVPREDHERADKRGQNVNLSHISLHPNFLVNTKT